MKYLIALSVLFIGLLMYHSNFQKPTHAHISQAAQSLAFGFKTAFSWIFEGSQTLATLAAPSLVTFLPYIILGILAIFVIRKVA